MNKPSTLCIVLCLLAQIGQFVPAQGDAIPAYPVEQYPTLQQRIPFFKERLLSPNPYVRYTMLGEIDASLPLSEAEQLLRHMMKQDDFEMTRQQALMRLLSDGYKIEKTELPKKVDGIDRTDAEALRLKLAQLRGEAIKPDERHRHSDIDPSIKATGANAGYPVKILGLLGDKSDIARLTPLLKQENLYVRLSVATALVNLGDVEAGKAALMEIANAPVIPENLFYKQKALLSLHRLGDEAAMRQFLSHLKTLERSPDGNAPTDYAKGLSTLAKVFGVWKNDVQEWEQWLQKAHD